MKIIYNSPKCILPPLHVKLAYSEEFMKEYNILASNSITIVGEDYVECSYFDKIQQHCLSWGLEKECGSDGLSISTKLSGNYCMFRRGDIPIWEEVKE